MRLCNSETTDGLLEAVLLFCDVHIGVTLDLLQCLCVICFVDVKPYRLTVWRHALVLLATCMYKLHVAIVTIIISSGSPLVFLECTSYYCRAPEAYGSHCVCLICE